jgi:hypothetical protein
MGLTLGCFWLVPRLVHFHHPLFRVRCHCLGRQWIATPSGRIEWYCIVADLPREVHILLNFLSRPTTTWQGATTYGARGSVCDRKKRGYEANTLPLYLSRIFLCHTWNILVISALT